MEAPGKDERCMAGFEICEAETVGFEVIAFRGSGPGVERRPGSFMPSPAERCLLADDRPLLDFLLLPEKRLVLDSGSTSVCVEEEVAEVLDDLGGVGYACSAAFSFVENFLDSSKDAWVIEERL